jgi:hypothetical protein
MSRRKLEPGRWNPADLHGPLLSDLLRWYRALLVPVKNEQVMHVCEVRYAMARLPLDLAGKRFDTARPFENGVGKVMKQEASTSLAGNIMREFACRPDYHPRTPHQSLFMDRYLCGL